MRYDRDFGPRGSRPGGDYAGRGEYGGAYEAPYPRHGFSRGFLGGSLRSRGSWYGGARRSGNEYDETDDLQWGGGYTGGRGHGGTNNDLEQGYATGRWFDSYAPRGGRLREPENDLSSPAPRGGYAWGEAEVAEEYGPARYGYGPYFERLRRRRRPDEEIRHEVEETLFFDTWVDADAIQVSVADGVVTLEGTLPSYDELRFAVDDAWDVEGVRGVRSGLEVDESRRPRRGGQGRGQTRNETVTQDPDEWSRHLHGHPYAGEGGQAQRGTAREDDRSTAQGQSPRRGGAGTGAQQPGAERAAGGRSRQASKRGAAAAAGVKAGESGAATGSSRSHSRGSTGRSGAGRGQGRGAASDRTEGTTAGAPEETPQPGSSQE